ncbi:MAG: TIR domain-containing protein [Leptolyngbya sp. SIO3F4]|nr:TIR domain-containing protein [Leptolyngbya sp. SIO3F4]
MTSFFISYNLVDEGIANWIAWILEEEGHKVIIQSWDFRPGSNFILTMQQAVSTVDKVIPVLSEDFLNSEFTQPEWAAAFVNDPEGKKRKLLPIRVRHCKPTGFLKSVVYVDLIGLEEEAARQKILAALPDRAKPTTKPLFSLAPKERTVTEKPDFSAVSTAAIPWNVPYEQNRFFTGREDILEELHQQLKTEQTAALSQIKTQAISGLGGIGKTQTAVEYAYRHRDEYRAVFWVRSETEVELSAGFVDMARLLDLPQKDAQDPADTIRGVKDWLETHSGWLLIFDNADQPDLLLPFRPRQGQGHTLLTSRAQVFDRFGITRPISLRKMPADEAVAFLLKRSGQETDDPAEKDAAAMLVKELDYLPLALEQAGAFILRRQLKFSTYLSQYRRQRLTLLDRQLPTVGNEQQPNRSVRTTWQLNFQAVQGINPASAELLRFSAFVAPDDIPYELLIRSRGSLGQILDDVLQQIGNNKPCFILILGL